MPPSPERLVYESQLLTICPFRESHLLGPHLVQWTDLHQRRFLQWRDVWSQKQSGFCSGDFERVAQFNGTMFSGEADFNAVLGRRAFSMSAAVFAAVPDFIQAHFEEAPRLDNLEVGGKLPELKNIEDEDRKKLAGETAGTGAGWRQARVTAACSRPSRKTAISGTSRRAGGR